MPDEKTILIARTKQDKSTEYVHCWAGQIKEEAELLGLNVVELEDQYFDDVRLKRLVEEYDPFLVFISTHGTQYSIKGVDGETDVVLRCKNDHLFKDRIVYALSCYSSVVLGKSSLRKGCKCYIGYNDKIFFPFQELDNPLEDWMSEPFRLASNEIVLALLKGESPEDAYNNSQKVFEEQISYWKKQNKPGASFIVKNLQRTKNIQVLMLAE